MVLLVGLSATLFACSSSRSDINVALSDDLTGIEHSDPVALGLLGDQLSVGEQFGVKPEDLSRAWFDGFESSVGSMVVEGDIATVEVTITCKRLQPAVDKSLPAINDLMTGPNTTDDLNALYEQSGKILLGNLQAEPLVTTVLTLTYQFENGERVLTPQSKKDLALELAKGSGSQ